MSQLCPGGQEGRRHPGLYQEWCGQQEQGDHSSPVLGTDADLINSLAISSTLWRNKQNEISIRLTHEIDIRKELSRNETMGLDKIREGHRKEIRTTLDTWTA
ncbi:hypothetical protein HGM15179_001413 [Zosterops borbonicus]|uniref:Uncharacterized protein n=1 Tax=Zosterops borbonicus TaxID=364589 RepID=A0A8K1GUL2_9PASS|nr:hypothetical protein HGM15179_001413 [Zosterops borbonicus]